MANVRASQIFTIKVEDAVAAKKELDAGSDFLALVEKFSVCPSKKLGGDLGWMDEENAQSLLGGQSLNKGQVLGPVHSPYGYHIILVTDLLEDTADKVFSEISLMSELNGLFPEVHSLLFKSFRIGLPVIGYKPEETIASVCNAHRKPVNEVLALVNAEYAKKSFSAISPLDLKARIESGDKNLVLLDIRERWEYDIACIEGAQLVTRENNASVLGSLGKDREIVLIDWKSDRAPSFVKWLTQRGFSNVRCLDGGIDAWSASVDTRLSRYDIDEDKDYRYQDIIEEADVNHPDH